MVFSDQDSNQLGGGGWDASAKVRGAVEGSMSTHGVFESMSSTPGLDAIVGFDLASMPSAPSSDPFSSCTPGCAYCSAPNTKQREKSAIASVIEVNALALSATVSMNSFCGSLRPAPRIISVMPRIELSRVRISWLSLIRNR